MYVHTDDMGMAAQYLKQWFPN